MFGSKRITKPFSSGAACSPRRPFIIGNWKMNNTYGETVVLAQDISTNFELSWADKVDVAVCPPSIALKAATGVFDFDNCPIAVGAQNVHFEPSGAYTGEISIPMIKEMGCPLCIIGHSERREYFNETNETVNLKVHALLDNDITPIICVGESLAIRDEGTYIDYVCKQVKAAFAGVSPLAASRAVVAYEPIWAIGTGRTATPEQAEEVIAAIRATLAKLYDSEDEFNQTFEEGSVSGRIRILYGGSMKPANVDSLMAMENIDGGLIGGASLKADSFIDLVKACLDK